MYRNDGFPHEVLEAIEAITKKPREDYQAYLNRVMGNAIALRVKIADMLDNMDIKRIAEPTEKDWKRLKKYQEVLPQLQAALFRQVDEYSKKSVKNSNSHLL